MTRSKDTVVKFATAHGWTVRWLEKLLVLQRELDGKTYLAQVLFREGRWWYALTFHRGPGYWDWLNLDYHGPESDTTVVRRRRDLFRHLVNPKWTFS